MAGSKNVQGRAVATRPRAIAPRREIGRGNRPQVVYEGLRDLIVRGELGPGARLIESDIAKRFGVSRTPVTLAIRQLEQDGYVIDGTASPHSRPTVAPLTRADATELFRIVGELESIAAEAAARLANTARRELVRDLASINASLRRASQEGRQVDTRLNDLDEQFHHRLVSAGAGPRLMNLHERIKPQAKRYARIYVAVLPNDVRLSVAEHNAIVEALREGDPTRAAAAVQRNWRLAAQRLALVIDTVGERASW